MKRILFLLILSLTYIKTVAQVKLNIWTQTDKIAQTLTTDRLGQLPQTFESKMPDGSTVIYEKWERPTISFTTSSGKKSQYKPQVYKATQGFGLVSLTNKGWVGIHQSGQGKVTSMTYNKVQSVNQKKDGLDCSTSFIEQTKEDLSNQINQQLPKLGKTTTTLTRQDFYNPDVPIPVTCSLYVEASYNLYQNFYPTGSGETQLVEDWLNLCYQGVSLVFFREGVTLELHDVLIWDTPDPYGYTTTNSISSILSKFSQNKINNLPRATPCFFKQILINNPNGTGGDGIAIAPPARPNGYTCNTGVPGSMSQVSAVNIKNYFPLPNPISNTSLYSWPIQVTSHEIGHCMGALHTHDCEFWKNEDNLTIKRIDSCNANSVTGLTCLPIKVPTDVTIPSIMSYCFSQAGATPPYAQDYMLQNGFGKFPRFAIRMNVFYSQNIGQKPSVNIIGSSNVTTTTATVTANLTSFGSLHYFNRGVRIWKTSLGVGSATSKNDQNSSSQNPSENLGEFTISFTDLQPNTNYSAQAYARNPFGTNESQIITFTTESSINCPPNTGIPQSNISNVTNNDISLGTISIGGSVTTTDNIPLISTSGIGFMWGLYPPGNQNSFSSSRYYTSGYSTTGTIPFLFSLNGQDVSSFNSYYYKSFATSNCGTGSSTIGELSPLSNFLPDVSTLPLTQVTSQGAILEGSVTSNYPITSRGFQIQRIDLSFTPSDYNISTEGTFQYQYIGLPIYPVMYRAWAENQYGKKYGVWRNLIVQNSQGVPIISGETFSKGAYTQLTKNALTCPIGPCTIIQKGVVWSEGLSTIPDISLPTKVQLDGSLGNYNVVITGLQPYTDYRTRPYVTYDYQGTQYTAYGFNRFFRTSQLGSCQILNLLPYEKFTFGLGKWFYKFNLNPSCSTYTVSISRYGNFDPFVPPATNATPITTSNRLTNYLPTPDEYEVLSDGIYGLIDKEMVPQPQLPSGINGSWFSINVYCNSGCTDTQPTKYFFYVRRFDPGD
jgi:hypothetical protein